MRAPLNIRVKFGRERAMAASLAIAGVVRGHGRFSGIREKSDYNISAQFEHKPALIAGSFGQYLYSFRA